MYYAGIGSRDTPNDIFNKMTLIAALLERNNFILRSGGATGADTAFEIGVSNTDNMCLYIPKDPFNGHTKFTKGCIYITEENSPIDYRKAYESLIIHPHGFKLSLSSRNMMIRNYFQINGHNNQPASSFVICWTPDSADGTQKMTSFDTGGTGQAIRIAAKKGIPVYNMNGLYGDMDPELLVMFILDNLKSNYNPHITVAKKTTSLF